MVPCGVDEAPAVQSVFIMLFHGRKLETKGNKPDAAPEEEVRLARLTAASSGDQVLG